MIDSSMIIILGLFMFIFTYKLYKKINGNPQVRLKNLIKHKEFRSVMLLFIITFSSMTLQYLLLSLVGMVFSTVLCITNAALIIVSFYWLQRLIH